MLPTRIKRRRKGYLEPSDSRWLATLYTHTKPYYAYDALGRPYSRDTEYPQKEEQHTAAFSYNPRSELTNAQLDEASYAYNYDNIGNRITAQEMSEHQAYEANDLNQYTAINGFAPTYDAEGNQTHLQTSTGIWQVEYNAQNRAVRFDEETSSSGEEGTSVTCAYDYMGRRVEKIVKKGDRVTTHQHYIYRGYLQIAALDMTRSNQPALWYITWDPSQPTVTRPLAIQKNGTWYPYGWDAAKNITEIFTTAGQLSTDYVYSPFGSARPAGDVEQPIQWSSEFYDEETGLVYYNFRYYNSQDGRWTRRDPLMGEGINLYAYVNNKSLVDILGLVQDGSCTGTGSGGESDNGKKKCDAFSIKGTGKTPLLGVEYEIKWNPETGEFEIIPSTGEAGDWKLEIDINGKTSISEIEVGGELKLNTDGDYEIKLNANKEIFDGVNGEVTIKYDQDNNTTLDITTKTNIGNTELKANVNFADDITASGKATYDFGNDTKASIEVKYSAQDEARIRLEGSTKIWDKDASIYTEYNSKTGKFDSGFKYDFFSKKW